MAAKSFLRIVAGVITQVFGVQTSAGAANAGDIPALDDTGRIHTSMMPVGIGADTAELTASEALAAGDKINIWTDSGVAKMRKADASAAGKEANGFVLAAVSSGATGTAYFEGTNTQLSGLTPGAKYFLNPASPGGITTTAPTTTGHVVQFLGRALSATSLTFEPAQPIQL